ncbi:hypothetical protein P7K49_023519, partial [Saguinus oedipus]
MTGWGHRVEALGSLIQPRQKSLKGQQSPYTGEKTEAGVGRVTLNWGSDQMGLCSSPQLWPSSALPPTETPYWTWPQWMDQKLRAMGATQTKFHCLASGNHTLSTSWMKNHKSSKESITSGHQGEPGN